MRKRIAEIIILASFLATLIVTNRNTQSEVETVHIRREIANTIIPERYKILSVSYEDTQEEIRNEIFYGELEEAALLVYAEAGNQDELGQRYVADVVFNRADNSKFPDSIYDVIYQNRPSQFTTASKLYEKADEVPEELFQLVLEEYFNRADDEIMYFRTGHYSECGTPAFKHGDHYFSTK